MGTSEKVSMQIGYVPNTDAVTDKALIMLSSADRKKSTLIALALNEFQEKYGFKIDSKEEIHSVIANYEFLRRANLDKSVPLAQPSELPVFNYEKKIRTPKKKVNVEPISINDNSSSIEPATIADEISTTPIQVGEEAKVSDEQLANMNKLKSLLGI